mmetsp:Transcript_6325/g.16401  ORF Transcript_6325/g.16401 Transcript_6325/m.16401 type:complete len:201 (+) Transcript_6325:176-778(+)
MSSSVNLVSGLGGGLDTPPPPGSRGGSLVDNGNPLMLLSSLIHNANAKNAYANMANVAQQQGDIPRTFTSSSTTHTNKSLPQQPQLQQNMQKRTSSNSTNSAQTQAAKEQQQQQQQRSLRRHTKRQHKEATKAREKERRTTRLQEEAGQDQKHRHPHQREIATGAAYRKDERDRCETTGPLLSATSPPRPRPNRRRRRTT